VADIGATEGEEEEKQYMDFLDDEINDDENYSDRNTPKTLSDLIATPGSKHNSSKFKTPSTNGKRAVKPYRVRESLMIFHETELGRTLSQLMDEN
jgi:hypothetical protein